MYLEAALQRDMPAETARPTYVARAASSHRALASAGQELAKSGQGWPGFARNSQGNVNNYTLPVPNIKKNDGIFSNMILEVSGEYSYAQLCPRGFW